MVTDGRNHFAKYSDAGCFFNEVSCCEKRPPTLLLLRIVSHIGFTLKRSLLNSDSANCSWRNNKFEDSKQSDMVCKLLVFKCQQFACKVCLTVTGLKMRLKT